MYKTVQTIGFFFAITILMAHTSCLNSGYDDTPQRTPEMELEELNQVLDKIIETGYNIDTTDFGIYSVTYEEGVGLFPKAGDTLFIEYTGYLLGGMIFDASIDHFPDGIWELIYKEKDLIVGFDDGLALLNKGAEMDLIIPSELAYGAYGNGTIPSYSTLIFSTKMHDIKPKQE